MTCLTPVGFVPKYGQKLKALGGALAAGDFRGGSCGNHQEFGTGFLAAFGERETGMGHSRLWIGEPEVPTACPLKVALREIQRKILDSFRCCVLAFELPSLNNSSGLNRNAPIGL